MENEKLKNQISNLKKERLKVTVDKLRLLKEEKEKFCTIPNFDGLKLTLKGKYG